MENSQFAGTKLALFIGGKLLVIRRDNDPDIPWPNHLDLPGGGRECGESAADCVLRETHEEVGLRLDRKQLVYESAYDRPIGPMVFFAAHLPQDTVADIVFGNEGQGWMLMSPEDYANHPEAVPHFREQITKYLGSR
ncbi:MAG: NUDIX hydrolase [Marinovum algicola]|jgi:8-oxo-dGTP diphosphatase|uniref:8-oxo-dGTP diphosphatase n=1 Tax=Marinovum algicola TaxID=42444 RepID=A0A975ZNU6_9RHOB|nr:MULTISPECIES: NUDIX hydrolase [Marinovum]AKO95572.1 ADP-ribose pyrophosphatase [Marinovum algicola DG 898]MDD9741489.1 NUDIX hydrolase [Marinovum sp. SP66]MDD9743816.1 NUDIX hydrolase [Marinovum sp. PR37]SEJ65798.1 8-oxo-dGTP diphosphatase [Marinovum algicola]SLN53549.1 nucleoside triphosphate pyrophosphohydrolase [Marinovum algicola]